MENGVGVDGTLLGDRNGVDEKVTGWGTEDKAVVGSDDLKESEEGDEEFLEAVEGGTPRVGPNERVFSDSGIVENIEDLDSGNGVEKFEEAVGTPVEAVNDEGEEDVSAGKDSSGANQVVGNELDGVDDKGIVEYEEKKVGDAAGETKDLQDGGEVKDKAGQVPKKTENGVMDHVSLDETVAQGTGEEAATDQQENQGHEPLGTQDANEVQGGDSGLLTEVESNGVIAYQEEKDIEVDETGGLVDTGLVGKHEELENTSNSLCSEHHSSDIEDHVANSVNFDAELKEKELPYQAGRNQDNNDKEQKEIQADSVTTTEHLERSPELGSDLQSMAEESVESSFALEDSAQKQDEKVDLSPNDMLAENFERPNCELPDTSAIIPEAVIEEPDKQNEDQEVNQTISWNRADLLAESSGGSQPHHLDAIAKVSEAVVNGTEKEDDGKEDRKANQSIPQNRDEQEVGSAKGVSSSGDISAVPGRPAGLAHSVLRTREQETIPGNRERQVRPTTDSSSSSTKSATSAPAGLGRAAPLLEPAPRAVQQPRVNGSVSQLQGQLLEDPVNGEGDETDETREKLQMIRVKFLRLAHRLGQTPHNVVVAQVLYRLGLAEQLRGRNGGRVAAFSFDRASAMAEQLEAAAQEPLDFSCTIMVLGKTGVGKSATINSIFDEIKFGTDAFQLGTKKVQDVVGTVQGIKVQVIDTPGLLPSWSDQRKNEKILQSVKQFMKKTPPDIVLYLDRLDMPSREFGDMPLLRTITEIFGPSIWFNAIVVLTHAASAPPEGPNGTATSYETFVGQRTHVVQQAIRQAAGDMRLMNPVSLVENHSACRTNRAGQRVLPNGQVWKPHLLLLSFASKILAEANMLLKLQDTPPGRPFASRTRSPPLPFLLSSLLQSRPPVKLPMEQFGEDDDALDDDLDDSSDSDTEPDYDELPPFKRLTKAQLAKLPKDQRKAYYDELEYRERLFMKKQLKEEKQRRTMMKKMQAAVNDLPSDYSENVEEESGGAAAVPIPMPDLALPASFDSDNPTHRYRYLDSSNQWLVRPVLEPNGWDHDVGYEGINAERLFVVNNKIPISFSGQVSKDKKDTNLQMEMASTVKHGEGKATSLGFDLQSVGKDVAYTLRTETRFSNWKKNKAVAGLSVTLLGDVLTGGLKFEDKVIFNKQGQVVVSGGAIAARGDVAYGGSLEATLRDKDHPLGRFLLTLGLSVMDWHGDLAIGSNFQGQIPIGRATNLIGRVNFNNRGSGQVSLRVNSSEHLQIALISLVPLVKKLLSYSQPVQFG